jgi:hypothetical protein
VEKDRAGTKKMLKQHRIKIKKISYRKFSFIHYDVMGSGRFFYVLNIGEVTVKF